MYLLNYEGNQKTSFIKVFTYPFGKLLKEGFCSPSSLKGISHFHLFNIKKMGFLKNMGVRKTLYISFYILLLATFHKKCCKYLGLSVTFSNFYNCFLKNMHP